MSRSSAGSECRQSLVPHGSPPQATICDSDIDEHEREVWEEAEQWVDEGEEQGVDRDRGNCCTNGVVQSASAKGSTEDRGRSSGDSGGDGGNRGKHASGSSIDHDSSSSSSGGRNVGIRGSSGGASKRKDEAGSGSKKEDETGNSKAKRQSRQNSLSGSSTDGRR